MVLRLSPAMAALLVASAALSGCLGGDEDDGTPLALFTVTPKGDGVTFLFDATKSIDPQGEELDVEWNFGDDGEQSGKLNEYGLIEYTYAVTDTTFMVSLVVRDPDGDSAYAMESISLGTGTNTAPEVHLKNATRWVKPGGGIVLDASKSDDHDADLFSYEWILGNYSADNISLDSGYLLQGQSFNHTFDKVGVYLLHCHPHPWMKMRVIVSDTDPNATSGTAQIDIRNFAYSQKTLVIAPGTTVTFVNKDPLEHTATLEWFSPGSVLSTGPILSAKLEEGDYLARLVLNDGKGGLTTKTYGVRASTDAPPNPLVTFHNVTVNHVPPAQPAANQDKAYKAEWPQNVTGSVSWENPTGRLDWKIELVSAGQVIARCVKEENTCTFVTNIMPGSYTIRLRIAAGEVVQGQAFGTVSAIQYSNPGFGDSDAPAGGDGHQHQH